MGEMRPNAASSKLKGQSNKRIKLSRSSAGGLTGGRRARSLSAVRWVDHCRDAS